MVRVLGKPPTGCLPLGSPLYIRRHADTRLEQLLKSAPPIIAILGARQMGKSSLLIRGKDYAEKSGSSTVFLDFQEIYGSSHSSNLDSFLKHLAYVLADWARVSFSVVDTVWATPLSIKVKLSRLVERSILENLQGPLVLFMDEIDILLNTNFCVDVFSLFRSWDSRSALSDTWRKLRIVMAISTYPSLLIDDPHQSPFNTGMLIELDDFNGLEVHDLNEKYGELLSSPQVAEMMKLLGGHPFLTQQALYSLASEKRSWNEFVAIAARDNGPYSDHLSAYLMLLHRDTDLCEAMRQVLISEAIPEGDLFLRLYLAGLVRREDKRCFCRYGLYDRFFRSQLL